MAWVVGVRFKPAGKIYYFDCAGLDISAGDAVIVETIRGVEYGTVVVGQREILEEQLPSALKTVIRKATENDCRIYENNRNKEAEALETCRQKIKEHNLPMRLIDVEYTFDMGKIIFYFTAEGRVDFRELVKDLASIFKTRIELRQIGVRDEAKMVGGIAPAAGFYAATAFWANLNRVRSAWPKNRIYHLIPQRYQEYAGGSCAV